MRAWREHHSAAMMRDALLHLLQGGPRTDPHPEIAEREQRSSSISHGYPELIRLLACCAVHVYAKDSDRTGLPPFVKRQLVDRCGSDAGLDTVDFALYSFLDDRGIYVMVFKDNVTMGGIRWSSHAQAIKDRLLPNAVAALHDLDRRCIREHGEPVSYITGYGFGGLLAEVVCARTGRKGASFNAPGPYSRHPQHSLIRKQDTLHQGVPFEAYALRKYAELPMPTQLVLLGVPHVSGFSGGIHSGHIGPLTLLPDPGVRHNPITIVGQTEPSASEHWWAPSAPMELLHAVNVMRDGHVINTTHSDVV